MISYFFNALPRSVLVDFCLLGAASSAATTAFLMANYVQTNMSVWECLRNIQRAADHSGNPPSVRELLLRGF